MARIGLALALVFGISACSGPGTEQNDLCAQTFCNVGFLCEPTTGECVSVNPGTDAGEDPVDAGKDPVDAGEDPVDAGEDPIDAGEDPVDAGEDPVDAGEEPVDAGEDPVDAGEDPVDAGEDPVDAGEEPVDAGEEPVDAGEDPVDAGEDPVDAGEDPVDAGEEPVDAGEDPVDAGAVACAPGCSGLTPICDEETNTCVTCTSTAGCSGETSVCNTLVTGGQCVTCTSTAGCAGDTSACDTTVAGGACVQCVDDETCEGDTPLCLVASNVCVGCLDEGDCSNPTPVCGANACRGCIDDGECANTAFCEAGGACRPLPDTCALALDVALPSPFGEVSFVADTTFMNNDTSGTCLAGAGAELVYRLPLAQAADLTVTVKPASGSAANPLFFLRQGTCQTGTEVACKNDPSNAASVETATLLNRSGDLFLFVETAGATRGTVDVTIKLEPPTVPPANDTCATASEGLLTFDTHGHAEATGSTLLATNGNPKSNCSYTSRQTGHDVVHSFVLGEVKDVSVRLEATVGSPLQPVVGVWPMANCETGTLTTELACQGDIGRSTQVSGVLLRDLAPGTYAVLVDGAADTAGRYRLSVDLSEPAAPPLNEDCGSAEELVFTDDIAAVAGDSWAAANHYSSAQSPSCSPTARSTGKDLFYKFTTTTTRNLTAHLIPTGVAPSLKPVLALRSAATCVSGSSSGEKGCEYSTSTSAVEMRVVNLPAGTWYFQVDSMGAAAAGPFELDVLLSDPPPMASNDDCSEPEELAFSGGRAVATGDLLAATNVGGTLSCAVAAGSTGRDLVFQYTLDQATNVSLAVIPSEVSTSGLAPVVSVHNACVIASGTELACKETTVGGRIVERPMANQAAGTYWIWVDANGAAAGAFKLDVQTGAPTNESCSSPQPLTLGQKAVGHTNFAANEYPSFGTKNFPGPDLVYAYTEQTGGQRTVTLRSSQLFDAGLIRLEGACAAANVVATVDAKPQGDIETMSFTAVAGTTYWFVVDGYSAVYGKGAFELEVR